MDTFSSKRRDFLKLCGLSAAALWYPAIMAASRSVFIAQSPGKELTADILIAGGGLGGCAAALAATRRGFRVILTEPTDWIGGQATQQGVSALDDHIWIESFGRTRSYAQFRNRIRDYYRKHYPMAPQARARKYLDPGDGLVSKLCCEPKVILAVLQEMLSQAVKEGTLILFLTTRPVGADVDGDRVRAIRLISETEGKEVIVRAKYFVDATELGDLLPLTGTEWVSGSESKRKTKEPHASIEERPHNMEAVTWCCILDYLEGEDHTIEKPGQYDLWRSYRPNLMPPWPGYPLFSLWVSRPISDEPVERAFVPTVGKFAEYRTKELNLWLYRRILNHANFQPGTFPSDITLINWPQNDYMAGNIFGGTEEENARHKEGARQLTLSLIYWLQTEAPRPDGKAGWPSLHLRKDVLGTRDGLAKYPYIRESRRIKAEFTILEQEICESAKQKIGRHRVSREFDDSIGVGHYDIDLHPTTGGDNYIDLHHCPYQIPLGALIPIRMENLLPGCKNIGTTHVSNGAYRLHHTEWNIGEAAGALAAFCLKRGEPPARVRNHQPLLREFQSELIKDGFELDWAKLATVRD
ncbi:MAG: FAD-dependent oxidoreductase [bacterium]